MIGEKLVRRVLPRPRKPLRLRDVLPLAVFLVLYAALCIWLEWSDTLMFANRAAFALIAVSVWIWWMHFAGYGGLPRARGVAALMIRLALLGVFVMVIAEPRAVRTRDVVSVIFAVDVSDSTGGRSTDTALEFVTKTVSEKKSSSDEAGLIIFGRTPAVELPPGKTFPFEALNSRIDRDATNLQESLSLAMAMLPEENRGRIVLISDGTETEGSLGEVLDDLQAREIAVDVLPIQYDYKDEVWIERLELPRFVKIGENYQASVVLSSLEAGEGTLVLRENGETISEQPIEFPAGKSRYTIPIYLREPGYYEYAASIEVPRDKDQLRENNTALNYIYVEGEGKVLVVVDPAGDDRDWQSLVQAIREGQRAVEVRSAYEFPRDSLSLMPYDCVVFVNVAHDAFDTVQMQGLHDAVYHQGIGFLMVGGPNSFGPGGYHRTQVEKVLPVTMDVTKKKILPKGALAIVLHTCEFPEGNTWGKRITKQAIKVLGAQDEVGVLIYSPMGEEWLFELTLAAEYDAMVPKINAAQIGDMPSFTTTMEMGLAALAKSDAATKHMIIITDGDPSPPPPPLLNSFVKEKISVTTVAIFPHGTGNDIATMRAIANTTGGRFYFPSDPKQLPSIFIKESKTLRRSMVQNETFYPQIGFVSNVLDGINELPPLHGYVLTTAKEKLVETILQTPPKGEEGDEIDPVLARWQYGLGKTAAFTSDLSPNWGADWVEWDKYQPFVKQLMTSISRVRQEGHLRMWTYTSGSEGVIMIEDFHPEESFLELQAYVSGPGGEAKEISLKQVAPRRYQASVPLWGKGRYQVMAAAGGGDRQEQLVGGFIVPYSPEYLRFRSDPIVLDEIAEKTGGEILSLDSTADLIYGRRQPKQSTWPVFDWFLIALACLVPLDVGIRRIQIDWFVIKSWLGLGRGKGESTATMGALLKRKQAVDSQLEARREEQPLPVQRATTATPTTKASPSSLRSGTKPPAGQTTKKQAQTKQPSSSTTGRLLEMKRRRQQDPDKDEK